MATGLASTNRGKKSPAAGEMFLEKSLTFPTLAQGAHFGQKHFFRGINKPYLWYMFIEIPEMLIFTEIPEVSK